MRRSGYTRTMNGCAKDLAKAIGLICRARIGVLNDDDLPAEVWGELDESMRRIADELNTILGMVTNIRR